MKSLKSCFFFFWYKFVAITIVLVLCVCMGKSVGCFVGSQSKQTIHQEHGQSSVLLP